MSGQFYHQTAHLFYGAIGGFGAAWLLFYLAGKDWFRRLRISGLQFGLLLGAFLGVFAGYSLKEMLEAEGALGGLWDAAWGWAGGLAGIWLYYRWRVRNSGSA